VTSDDAQVLALVQELVRLLSTPQQGGMEVIRLQHASAVDVARAVDEAFNGRTAPGKGGVRAERVRIVAEPITNALLVRASPLDLLTIRNLLAARLDVPTDRGEAGVQTYFFKLRYATAAHVAKVLRELYRDGGKPTVTLAVDDRTNALILRGSAVMYQEVRKLVDQLDVKEDRKKQ
jgi:general secretion pathway protein D